MNVSAPVVGNAGPLMVLAKLNLLHLNAKLLPLAYHFRPMLRRPKTLPIDTGDVVICGVLQQVHVW